MLVVVLDLLFELFEHWLSVAEKHLRVLLEEKRVGDVSVAGTHGSK